MALYMPQVLTQALEAAINGDKAMIKLLLEMHISKAAPQEDDSLGKDTVRVTINDLTLDNSNAKVSITKTVETPHLELKEIEDVKH